jgi:uncharacterized protein YukE
VSINLPGQVVWFLNAIGVNWPAVDEDQVRFFAGHVRDFSSNIEDTHHAASSTINRMSESYSGRSYEELLATWARMSKDHMIELITACEVVATALDAAADAIVAAKLVAIGELVGLAVSFVADQAAAVLTLGLAEAAEGAIVLAARKCVNALVQQLEQHIMGKLIQAAIAPLERTVERALGGLVFKGLDAALGDPTAGAGGAGSGFSIMPEELMAHANTLRGHADEVATHATTFARAASGVSFGG